ncbi:MAG TPA: DUF2490 domain-containing protein [Coleofasciculaceae cyanobacterium]|jgi:hypothetical protein
MAKHFGRPFWVLMGLFFVAALLSPAGYADSYLEDDLQSWNMVTLNSRLSPGGRVLGYLEAQSRTGNNIRDAAALIIRPALGYKVTKSLSVWQGYAWASIFVPKFRNENRIFQQVLLENEFKRFKLTNRTRLEERFIEDTDGTSVRGRHQVRVSVPFGKSRKWAYVVYDEIFVNFNTVSGGPHGGFEQNRVFGGMNRTLNAHANVELGYLGQFIRRYGSTPDVWNHVIMATLNLRVR